jgi:hypothetical protein
MSLQIAGYPEEVLLHPSSWSQLTFRIQEINMDLP